MTYFILDTLTEDEKIKDDKRVAKNQKELFLFFKK